MFRRLITARALLILACLGAVAASAPLAAARSVAAVRPRRARRTWKRVVTQADIDRTASFLEEPSGWEAPLTGPYTLVLATARSRSATRPASPSRRPRASTAAERSTSSPTSIRASAPSARSRSLRTRPTLGRSQARARADAGRRPLCRPQLHPRGPLDARQQRRTLVARETSAKQRKKTHFSDTSPRRRAVAATADLQGLSTRPRAVASRCASMTARSSCAAPSTPPSR